jgi:hypothetical protein
MMGIGISGVELSCSATTELNDYDPLINMITHNTGNRSYITIMLSRIYSEADV